MRYVLVGILILSLLNAHEVGASTAHSSAISREVPMSVKVVFVGLHEDWVDLNYLPWKENLPSSVTNEILIGGDDTGVAYSMTYSYSFASSEFKDRFLSYLKSIEATVTSKNPWFYYWKQEDGIWTQVYKDVKNTLYDANKVESWVYENSGELGGFRENGYTFVISYLPELPSMTFDQYKGFWNDMKRKETSTPHYYNVSYEDADLGYKLRYRDFMTGWGGHHRFWFFDLSAGPARWYDVRWDLPLQVVLKDMKLDLHTAYGKKWFTEYLADYLWGITRNFSIPQFLYDPILTSNYRLAIYVLDNRTKEEKSAVPITSTVNSERIRAAFKDLAPYAETEVQITFKDTSEYPELLKLLVDHYKYLDSWTYAHVWDDPQRYGSVDIRPIYKYLQDNLATFVPHIGHDENEFTIPVFAFAFSGETYFTYSYKWMIDRRDPETGALWGMALGDMTIIGLCQYDFRRGDNVTPKQRGKGYGFTQTIIHEVGHIVGLVHPHSFDWLGDFSLSAMGYFTYDYTFGQFDKDALQRIHADKVMMETSSTILDARATLETRIQSPETESLVAKAEGILKQASTEYSNMNYAGAMRKALEARELSRTSLEKASVLPVATTPLEEKISQLEDDLRRTNSELEATRSQIPMYLAAGLGAGLAVAVVVFLVLKRRAHLEKSTEIQL